VGLVTGPVTPSAAAKPCANVVLPAPSRDQEQHVPGRARRASRPARACVEAGRRWCAGARCSPPTAPVRDAWPARVGAHLRDPPRPRAEGGGRVIGGHELGRAGRVDMPRSFLMPSPVSGAADGQSSEPVMITLVGEGDLAVRDRGTASRSCAAMSTPTARPSSCPPITRPPALRSGAPVVPRDARRLRAGQASLNRGRSGGEHLAPGAPPTARPRRRPSLGGWHASPGPATCCS